MTFAKTRAWLAIPAALLAIAPSAKQLLGIFFKIYLARPHSAKK
jgi:hypothetical protein